MTTIISDAPSPAPGTSSDAIGTTEEATNGKEAEETAVDKDDESGRQKRRTKVETTMVVGEKRWYVVFRRKRFFSALAIAWLTTR